MLLQLSVEGFCDAQDATLSSLLVGGIGSDEDVVDENEDASSTFEW